MPNPPSLEGLEVAVVSPSLPDADELIRQLHARLREHAPMRPKSSSELLQWGDLIVCDIITLVDGRVLPGGVRQGVEWELQPFPNLPGLAEALVGQPSKLRDSFELTLPPDYPVAAVAGKLAVLDVEVRQAFALEMSELDDSQALQAAGLGEDVETALRSIAEEIEEESGQQLLVEASRAVLDELARRADLEISPSLLEEELTARWSEGEGALLLRQGFAGPLLEQARRDYLADLDLRADAERRLKINMALGALIEAHGIQPSAERLEELLESAAELLDLTPAAVKGAVDKEKAAWTALHLAAVDYVVARAKITVIDGDESIWGTTEDTESTEGLAE